MNRILFSLIIVLLSFNMRTLYAAEVCEISPDESPSDSRSLSLFEEEGTNSNSNANENLNGEKPSAIAPPPSICQVGSTNPTARAVLCSIGCQIQVGPVDGYWAKCKYNLCMTACKNLPAAAFLSQCLAGF